jgi:outer membrane protein assembly factor BamB
MRRITRWAVLVVCALVVPLRGADWPTHSGDNQRTAWQRDETALTKSNVKGLQLLWKLKLENQQRSVYSLTAPIVLQRAITDHGFKELVFVAGTGDNLFAVDADLGKLFWKKHFDYQADIPQQQNSSFLCPGGLTATPVLQPSPTFGRGRGAAAPAAPPAPAPLPPGAAAPSATPPPQAAPPQGRGGNPFAVRSLYLVSSDGTLHQMNVNNGDEISAAHFMPPNGKPYSLAFVNNVIYSITAQGCGGNPNSAYAIDLSAPDKPVYYWRSGAGGLWGLAGPAVGADGIVYAETGDGQFDAAAGRYPNSIVALTPKELKLKDYYTPTNADWLFKRDLDMNVTPVIFPYKDRELLVGSGKEGRFFLLDTKSLGGPDHRTPLFRSELISNEEVDFAGAGTWGSLASWEDAQGTRWVLAPVWGPKHPNATFPITNGEAPHGSIAAFKVVEKDGKPVLMPAWISGDLITPAPPVIANGVVFALETGEYVRQANDKEGGLFQVDARAQRSTHATLHALDATTGQELYSSGNAVTSFTHYMAMAVANGRVYFGTYDNTLYCFGFPMEH